MRSLTLGIVVVLVGAGSACSLLDGEEAAPASDTADALVADLGLDDEVRHNRRGPLKLRWVYLHLLQELARHAGHGDILRELVLAQDAGGRS